MRAGLGVGQDRALMGRSFARLTWVVGGSALALVACLTQMTNLLEGEIPIDSGHRFVGVEMAFEFWLFISSTSICPEFKNRSSTERPLPLLEDVF